MLEKNGDVGEKEKDQDVGKEGRYGDVGEKDKNRNGGRIHYDHEHVRKDRDIGKDGRYGHDERGGRTTAK